MELLVTALTLLLFVGLLLSPIFLLRFLSQKSPKYNFIHYLTIGMVMTAIIMMTLAWWNHASDLILLKHYGYNRDGTNDTELYGKVLPENIDEVKRLEASVMGIGWPLKAILGFIVCLPYLIVVYGVKYLSTRQAKKALVNERIELSK